MEHEAARYACIGDDGTSLTVIEHRFTTIMRVDGRARVLPGARRLALSTGECVRYIDANTFEVIHTGEIVRRI